MQWRKAEWKAEKNRMGKKEAGKAAGGRFMVSHTFVVQHNLYRLNEIMTYWTIYLYLVVESLNRLFLTHSSHCCCEQKRNANYDI